MLENHAKVTGGTIEKNYSKDVSNVIINNNYSNEVGENVIIKKNFAESIDNATIENQYYKLTINGNINLVCAIDSNNNLEDNIYTKIPEDYETLEEPTRDGYKFLGYFTEKEGGTSFENYYNEAGIDKEMTLYAQWQENSSSAAGEVQPEESDKNPENAVIDNTNAVEDNNSTVIGKNPQTGDNIITAIIILGIAVIGIIITTKMKKYKKAI